jgi:hypothetical protein
MRTATYSLSGSAVDHGATMMLGRHWCREDSGKNNDSAQYSHGYLPCACRHALSSIEAFVFRSQNNPARTRSRTVASIDLDAHFVSLAPDEGMVARRAGMRARGAFVPYGGTSLPTVNDASAIQSGVAAWTACIGCAGRAHAREHIDQNRARKHSHGYHRSFWAHGGRSQIAICRLSNDFRQHRFHHRNHLHASELSDGPHPTQPAPCTRGPGTTPPPSARQ